MPGKRGNGQGSARKRGKTWTAIWTVGWVAEDGKLSQKVKTKGGFATKTAALAYASNPDKVAPAVKIPTLQHYWEIWSGGEMPKLSKSKQCAAKIAQKKLAEIMFEPIDRLSIGRIQELIQRKAPTYYPAKDIKTLLTALYKMALAEEQVRTNLAEFISLPKLEEEEQRPFTEMELRKFWDAYGAGDHFVGHLLLMIYTGMMPGELFTLKKEMIDWEEQTIFGCGLKTKKRKQVPIVFPAIITPVLEALCARSTSPRGKVCNLNKDNFYKQYHEATARIGVRDLPPYSCRHTTATALALDKSIAPSVIQEVMRHSRFSTTERYIHPDISAAKAAVNRIGKGENLA